MGRCKERILKERLEQLERWKAEILKRMEDVKSAGEAPLNNLIGKYYKAKDTRVCMIVKVTDWIPDVDANYFTLFVNRINITFPTEAERAYITCVAEDYEYVEGAKTEDAARVFLERFEEITEDEYNEYKKKANQIITDNF